MREHLLSAAIVLALVSLISLGLFWVGPAVSVEPEAAQLGQATLKASDLQGDATLNLNGEWEFYDGQLLQNNEQFQPSEDLAALQSNPDQNSHLVTVPSSWNAYNPNRVFPKAFGFGTYHLRVNLEPNANANDLPLLAVRTINIGMANRVFVDGVEISKSGLVGADKNAYLPGNVPQTGYFKPKSPSFDLVIQVANFDYFPYSGIVSPVVLGTPAAILKSQAKARANEWTSATALLTLGLLFLGIFLFMKRLRYLIYYTLSAWTGTIYVLTHGEKLFYDLFPSFNYRLFMHVQYLSAMLSLVFLLQLLRYSMPSLFKNRGTSALLLLSLLDLTVGLFTPIVIQSATSYAQMGLIIAGILFILHGLIRGILRKSEDSLFIGIGALAILVYASIAILGVLGYHHYNAYALPMLITFVAANGFLLAFRYTNSFKQIERLHLDLAAKEQQKRAFIARTTYEIRSPLQDVVNLLTLYQGSLAKKPGTISQDRLDVILGTAGRLSKLVKDLQDVSNLDESPSGFELEPLWADDMIREVINVCRFVFEEKGIAIDFTASEEKSQIIADANRFRQTLFNLIELLMMKQPAGGIKILSEREKDQYRLLIQAAEQNPAAIARLDTEYSAGSYQSDLGLALVREIIEKQQGHFEVKASQNEITYVLTYILAKEKEGQAVASPSEHAQVSPSDLRAPEDSDFAPESPATANPEKSNVLVLSSSVADRQLIEDALVLDGMRVSTAQPGKLSVEQTALIPHLDLVVLNINEPDFSGYDLCHQIRGQFNLAELPILFLTRGDLNSDVSSALKAGANDYLLKPYHIDELRARCRSLILMKQASQQSIAFENAFLNARIKPHFLYNALNTIASLCETEGVKAGDLILALAKYLRGTLDFENLDQLIPLEKELSLVSAYLEIEEARFPHLQVDWDIDPDSAIWVPPVSIQTLVENAVKHGALKNPLESRILIRVQPLTWENDSGKQNRENSGITQVAVIDNGPGFKTDPLATLRGNANELANTKVQGYTLDQGSVGLLNLERRLVRRFGKGLKIERTPDHLTSCSFEVPEAGNR